MQGSRSTGRSSSGSFSVDTAKRRPPLAALPVEQGEITRKSRTGVSAGNRRFYEHFNCRQTAARASVSPGSWTGYAALPPPPGQIGEDPRRHGCDAMMCPRVLRPWRDLRELR